MRRYSFFAACKATEDCNGPNNEDPGIFSNICIYTEYWLLSYLLFARVIHGLQF